MAKTYVIDVETDGLNERESRLIGVGYYSRQAGEEGFLTEPEQIRAFFEAHKDDRLVYHHGSFDIKCLARPLGYLPTENWWFDTRLGASLLPDRPGKLSLEHCAGKYLNIPPWKEEDFLDTIGEQAVEDVKEYCLKDCKVTYDLAGEEYSRLKATGVLPFMLETYMPIARMCVRAEWTGCAVDRPRLETLIAETLKKSADLEAALRTEYQPVIDEYEGRQLAEYIDGCKRKPTEAQIEKKKKTFAFNFCSATQVKWLLVEKFKIPCVGLQQKVSTGKDVLALYQDKHPIIAKILELRHLKKLADDFVKWWSLSAKDGRIYAHYNLDIARTGRLSSSDPLNLQNVPKGEPRTLFIAPPGHTLAILDYAQIEPRNLAHISQDPILIAAFESGDDFYSVLAKETLGLQEAPNEIKVKYKEIRDLFKTVGLAILYGIGPAKLAGYLSRGLHKVYSYRQASAVIERLLGRLQGVAKLRQRIADYHAVNGRLFNVFGRPLYLTEDELFHKGINTIVQSSASDLNCIGHLKLTRALQEAQLPARLCLLVHDEGVYEVPLGREAEFEKLAIEACQESFHFRVKTPVEIKFGPNWGSK